MFLRGVADIFIVGDWDPDPVGTPVSGETEDASRRGFWRISGWKKWNLTGHSCLKRLPFNIIIRILFIILVVSHTSMKYVKSSGFHLTLSLYIYIWIYESMFVPKKWTYLFLFQGEDKWKRYLWNHEGICTSWLRFDDHGGHRSRMWNLDLNISQHLWASCQSSG